MSAFLKRPPAQNRDVMSAHIQNARMSTVEVQNHNKVIEFHELMSQECLWMRLSLKVIVNPLEHPLSHSSLKLPESSYHRHDMTSSSLFRLID